MNIENIGKKMRKERINKKLNQRELADKLGITENYLGRIERGDKFPSLEVIAAIADFFNLSIDYLLKDDEIDDLKTKIFKINRILEKEPAFIEMFLIIIENNEIMDDRLKCNISKINKMLESENPEFVEKVVEIIENIVWIKNNLFKS